MWFPSSTNPHSYRQGQQQAAHMLKNKHGDNYMVRLLFIVRNKYSEWVQAIFSEMLCFRRIETENMNLRKNKDSFHNNE